MKSIDIQHIGCGYTFQIPIGWDTIPSSIGINNQVFDFGLYPIDQNGFFDNNYILFSFMPTAQPLSSLSFESIFGNYTQLVNNYKNLNDSIKINCQDLYYNHSTLGYSILLNSYVQKDTIDMWCLQDLIVTNFGYISVQSYSRTNEEKLLEIDSIARSGIEIEKEYLYSEPIDQSATNSLDVVLSILIGLTVYVTIFIFDKVKNNTKHAVKKEN